jgi:predicted methyltransferase
VIALLLAACSQTAPPAEPREAPAPHAEEAPVVAHGAPGESHEVHGRPHDGTDHATVNHRFDDAARWAEVFDDPERDAWQKPADLVAALNIAPGSTVADVGAGTGYFNAHLSRAVGPEGKVLAVDVEQSLVDWMTERATKEGTANVEARLGQLHDPALKPGEADLVLLVDTYHHIDGRVDWFTRLGSAMAPGGRLAIVDFKPGDLPVGPPESHRIPQEQVVAELEQAGWTPTASPDVLPYQFVQVLSRR